MAEFCQCQSRLASDKQKRKLLQFLATRVNGEQENKAPTDLARFAGTVRLPEDPLAWQQRVRGEWQ